jgi:uncharacterized protein YggT (Ycf19 family)
LKTAEARKRVLFIIAKTISVILSVVSFTMLIRMILPWFVDPMESTIYALACLVTEPFVAPVRAVMFMFNIGQDSPIDWSFSIAYILIWLLQSLLPAI